MADYTLSNCSLCEPFMMAKLDASQSMEGGTKFEGLLESSYCSHCNQCAQYNPHTFSNLVRITTLSAPEWQSTIYMIRASSTVSSTASSHVLRLSLRLLANIYTNYTETTPYVIALFVGSTASSHQTATVLHCMQREGNPQSQTGSTSIDQSIIN